jgi:hypothetical protein
VADERTARQVLVSISLADHLGDVNGNLPRLAELLGEPAPPVWCDECDRNVWPWEDGFHGTYGHTEDYEGHDD